MSGFGSVGSFPNSLGSEFFPLLFASLCLAACLSLFFLFFVFSLCLFRAEVSAPQYQSVGHSGADQSVSGTGSFRGEGEKPWVLHQVHQLTRTSVTMMQFVQLFSLF